MTQCQWQKRLDPDLRHLRERDRHLQLREPALGLGRRRAVRGLRDDRRHPAAADHRRRHHGRAAADRSPRARLRAQGCGRAESDRGRRRREIVATEWNDKHQPAYRLYEVQNGNHIETYQDTFPQLELIEPHAQRAFDLLVEQVEARRDAAARSVHSARRRRSPPRLRSRDTARTFSRPRGAESAPFCGEGSKGCKRINRLPCDCPGETTFSLWRWRITDAASCRPPFRRPPSARDGVVLIFVRNLSAR